MNRMSHKKRTLAIRCLVEGMGVRATARTANIDKKTVLRLLVEAGTVASQYQNDALRELTCKHVEVDELWSFVYAK